MTGDNSPSPRRAVVTRRGTRESLPDPSHHCDRGASGRSALSCNWSSERRPGHVQSGDRQQAAWLRPRRPACGRCGAQRVRRRPSNCPPEENWSTRSVRADRGHAVRSWTTICEQAVGESAKACSSAGAVSSASDHAAVCTAGRPVDQQHRL
jgi:hypothetical protein